MLMDTKKTRRAALHGGILADLSEEAGWHGMHIPTAISQGALSLLCEANNTGELDERDLVDIVWMYRLHESGKMEPVRIEEEDGRRSVHFKVFANREGEPVDVALKGVTGLGDYGEEVLTISLPEEEYHFTGGVTRMKSEYVLHLSKFLAKDNYGPEMTQYVSVSPHPERGALLCAMNLHSMGLFHDVTAHCREPFLFELSPEMLRHCKPKYDDIGGRFVVIDGGRASVEDARDNVLHIEPGEVIREGEYPDYMPMLEKAMWNTDLYGPTQGIALPADLSMFNFQTKREGCALRFFTGMSEGSVVVRHTAFPEFVGIVMPVTRNGDDVTSTVPPLWISLDKPEEWFGEEEKPEATDAGAAPKKCFGRSSLQAPTEQEEAPENAEAETETVLVQ